jgi:hypothetical protein
LVNSKKLINQANLELMNMDEHEKFCKYTHTRLMPASILKAVINTCFILVLLSSGENDLYSLITWLLPTLIMILASRIYFSEVETTNIVVVQYSSRQLQDRIGVAIIFSRLWQLYRAIMQSTGTYEFEHVSSNLVGAVLVNVSLCQFHFYAIYNCFTVIAIDLLDILQIQFRVGSYIFHQ